MTWIQTRSNIHFDLLNPTPEMVDINDIAWSLSNLARYNGHTRFYSVAEHSVLVAKHLLLKYDSRHLAFIGLMHDAAEAYVGDLCSPVKRLPGVGEAFEAAEQKVWEAIAAKFDLPLTLPRVVKDADIAVLLREKETLFSKQLDWKIPGEPSVGRLFLDAPPHAKQRFLNMFHDLRR